MAQAHAIARVRGLQNIGDGFMKEGMSASWALLSFLLIAVFAGQAAAGSRGYEVLRLFFGISSSFLLILFPEACVLAEIELPPQSVMAIELEEQVYPEPVDQWKKLEDGLEFGEFHMPQNNSSLAVLRIDPEKFDFALCSSTEEDSMPKTLARWASDKKLSAAINASMYLPDNRTSTGYMRHGIYVNNAKIAQRFGAFFVAGPRKPGLPRAALVEKGQPNWREILDDYDLVIQNYRMINSARRVLWEQGGPRYAISAVGQDGQGRILFLHSRAPVDAWDFANELLRLPLNMRAVMYVEGGAQAGLVVDSGGLRKDLGGAHAPSFIITGNLRAALPNVLGIRPRRSLPAE